MGLLHDHLPLTLVLGFALSVSSTEVYAMSQADMSRVPSHVA